MNLFNRSSQIIALSLLLGGTTLLPAWSADGDPTAAPAPAATTTTSTVTTTTDTTTTAKPPLEGGVEKVTLSLEQLRDVGLDLKNLLKSISSLYDEVTIQPVSMVFEPEVVGRGMVINIPVATQAVGPPQPPRKARVDLAMNGITPAVSMMKSNVDAFVNGKRELDLPPDLEQTMQPQLKEWVSYVDDLSAQLTQLQTLTAGPTYDNAAIGAVTKVMQDNVKKLDDTRRTIYKDIRDDGKRKRLL